MSLATAPTLGELESAADTARAVMAEISGGKEPPQAAPEPVEAPAEERTTPAAEPAQEARARDDKGRFAPKEGKDTGKPAEPAAEPASAAPPSAEAVESEPPTEPAIVAEDEVLEPLADWTVEQQDEFRKLTPASQRFVLDRAQAAIETAQEAQMQSGRYNGLEDVLAPRRTLYNRDGLDDISYIRSLASLSDFAAQDPAGFARWFMQQRGIGPEQLWPEEAGQVQVDPNMAALRQELDSLRSFIQNQQQTAEVSTQQQALDDVRRFTDERDANGRLVHPYFEQVRGVMGALMGAGKAPDLNTAYDMACRADPDVSAKIAAAHNAQAERERARQNREKAAAAKNAGSSVSGTPVGQVPAQPSDDPREDMRRQMAERGLIS